MIIIVAGCNYGYRRSLLFRNHGAVANATVIYKYETDDDYHVMMAYTVDGAIHEKLFTVTKSQYRGWPLHDTIEITYLRRDPQDAEVGRETDATVKAQKDSVIGFIVMYVPFGWLVFAFCDMSVRRQRRLARFGVLVQCTVTDVWRRGDGGLSVDYRYEVGGAVYTSRAYVAGFVPAVIGQPLPILYLERKPNVSMLLDAITLARPG